MNKSFRKFLIYYCILAIIAGFMLPRTAKAASLSAISDTLTRIKAATLSSHTIAFTLGGATTLDAGETVTIDFDKDGSKFSPNGATTVVGDLSFNDGTARNIVDVDGSCVGHNGVNDIVAQVNDTTGVLTFTACGTFTSSGAGAAVTVKYGTAAGGTNRVTNPAVGTYVINIVAAGDTGSFASAIITDDQVVVSTTIDAYISFTLTTNTVTLTKLGGGNPDWNNTGYNQGAANTLAASTNGGSGYSITYNGDTLKKGGDSIAAMAAKAASATNTEQFGINLRDNTTPDTGADKTGGGSGAPAADYNTIDQFRYIVNTATTLASAAANTTSNTFTVSYIVNVTGATKPGAYQTTITYICTGNF